MSDQRITSEADFDAELYWRPVWRRRWMVLALVVIATVAVYVYEDRKTPIFESGTSVFIQEDPSAGLFSDQSRIIIPSDRGTVNQAKLIKSRAVAAEVKRAIRSPASPDALRGAVTVQSEEGSDFISIVARDSTGAGAATLANAYADAFVAARQRSTRETLTAQQRSASTQLEAVRGATDTAQASREELRSRIRLLASAAGTATGGAEQVDEAVQGGQIAPSPRRSAVFAFALTLLGAVMLALFLERIDRRLKHVDELSELYNLPLLATVPRAREPAPIQDGLPAPSPDLVESMRSLRVNLSLQSLDKPLRRLLVTSALPGEGKTTVARNLALAYREAGVDVVVVEADLRKPSLSKALGREPRMAGLTGVLVGDSSLDASVIEIEPAPTASVRPAGHEGKLSLLPSGGIPANPPAILGSDRMVETIARLAERHELVLIDSPPLLAVSDTLPLMSMVDGVIIVGRVALTNRDAARRVRDVIARIPGVRMLGVVADDASAAAGHYRDYGYESAMEPEPGTPVSASQST